MIAAGIPGQWYDRLNQSGPESGLVPSLDDEPPFHLQRPSSDEGSYQPFLEEPVSSRFGGNSQPQPLSHSLLSRLELSENDPNTFRDIIDDLTVQNKSLKRQLKRYEKTQSISKAHNGLFEVRIHNLPAHKKRELEVILQKFTATVQSPQYQPGPMPPTTRGKSSHRVSERTSTLSLRSPPSMQALDSTYASVSATGLTIPAARNLSTRPGPVSHEQLHDTPFPGASSAPQPHDESTIPNRLKKEIIVQKLEQIFENDLGVSGVSNQGDDLQPSQDWVYLNLLVNMAQLHTLNVTSEFVRRTIQESSTKLVLSDDGCKVRWRGHAHDTSSSPKKEVESPTTSLTFPTASRSVEQVDRGISIKRKDGVQVVPTTDLQPAAIPVRRPSSMISRERVPNLHYKPMFASRKSRSAQSHDLKDDRSDDSDISSSSKASFLAEPNDGNQNGPMVFLDRDPFFLDLSADPPNGDLLVQTPYGRVAETPLGSRNRSTRMYREIERRSSCALPAGSDEVLHNSIQFKSLTIYNDDPNPIDRSTTDVEHVELEASGMGGIQLEDNFAIDVQTEQHPPLSQSVPPEEDVQASHTISVPSNRLLPTHQRPVPVSHHRRLVSATTTHLSPSPLPPPSYVYPAMSSSSSSDAPSDDDDILNDVDSVSELEFRPLSLSPQMRLFLEDSEEASEPEDDDGDVEVEDDGME
ncbi:MAG: hypothetical protein Q9168_001303 [Polycauliona sp. 1 TL-2023]